jgi:hypothetical protein
MFRLLGILAALNLRLNRIRFWFVPLNLAVAVLLLLGVSDGLERLAKGATNLEPQPVTVADLAAGRVAPGSFVRVSGFVQANLVLELGKKGANGQLEYVRDRLLLLHDAAAPAVWLRLASDQPDSRRRATYVGMVRSLPGAARTATVSKGGTIDGRVPSMGHLLEEGSEPRSFVSGVVHLTVCAPPLALLAWVSIRRGLIYRRGQRARNDDGTPSDLIDMRVSGVLRLHGRTSSRRFVEVDAGLQGLPGGGAAVVANVDASTYLMGMQAIDREGAWTVVIPAGAALSVELGEVAFGLGVRPAARVEVREDGRTMERLTLTFGSGWQRDRVLQLLGSAFPAQRAAA